MAFAHLWWTNSYNINNVFVLIYTNFSFMADVKKKSVYINKMDIK